MTYYGDEDAGNNNNEDKNRRCFDISQSTAVGFIMLRQKRFMN